jgi:uncharacterized YigZ family protein
MTILTPALFTYEILGSRFIGLAFPLDEDFVLSARLEALRKDYPDATHYCYAARFGKEEKASDDGEPSHTAGLPLLDLLRKQDLTEVLLVVVRYFGGTKLGAGRLTRTYRLVGEKTLGETPRAELVERKRLLVTSPYDVASRLKEEALYVGLTLLKEHFSLSVSQTYEGDAKIIDAFRKSLPETSQNQDLGTFRSRRRKTL